jgi:hypothetical protein
VGIGVSGTAVGTSVAGGVVGTTVGGGVAVAAGVGVGVGVAAAGAEPPPLPLLPLPLPLLPPVVEVVGVGGLVGGVAARTGMLGVPPTFTPEKASKAVSTPLKRPLKGSSPAPLEALTVYVKVVGLVAPIRLNVTVSPETVWPDFVT